MHNGQCSVEIEISAVKALSRLQRNIQVRIAADIKALAIEPRPHDCTKLAGSSDAYRIRTGNYRVVYTINDTARIVRIEKIAHRREV